MASTTPRSRSRAATTAPVAADMTTAAPEPAVEIKDDAQYYIRLTAPVTYDAQARPLVPQGTQHVSGWVLKQLIGQPGLEKYEELVDGNAEDA